MACCVGESRLALLLCWHECINIPVHFRGKSLGQLECAGECLARKLIWQTAYFQFVWFLCRGKLDKLLLVVGFTFWSSRCRAGAGPSLNRLVWMPSYPLSRRSGL